MIILLVCLALAAAGFSTWRRQQARNQALMIMANVDRSKCGYGMVTLAGVLEGWKAEHHRYPARLTEVVPKAMRAIPTCPIAGGDTFSPGYQVSDDGQRYTYCCQGGHHLAAQNGRDNIPQYSSQSGLIDH